MAWYKCLRNCQSTLRPGFFKKGGVFEFPSDPGANFVAFDGDVFSTERPPHKTDLQRTYYFGSVGWDDLRFPFTGLNPPGQASDPDISPIDGLPLFDDASTEIIVGVAQMPHAWEEGSTIVPHIHWSPTDGSAGNVLWRFDYQKAGVNGVFPGSWTTIDVVDAAAEVDDTHQIAGFGNLDMAGELLSTIIKWRIARVGGDVLDTYVGDARGIEFDIHYRTDSIGSGLEFEK